MFHQNPLISSSICSSVHSFILRRHQSRHQPCSLCQNCLWCCSCNHDTL